MSACRPPALATAVAPVGDSSAVYSGTGLLPYILCFYPGRMMNIVMLQNRAMLGLLEIVPMHLVVARAARDPHRDHRHLHLLLRLHALRRRSHAGRSHPRGGSLVVAIYLGIGIGVFNAVFGTLMGQFYQVAYILIMVGLLTA